MPVAAAAVASVSFYEPLIQETKALKTIVEDSSEDTEEADEAEEAEVLELAFKKTKKYKEKEKKRTSKRFPIPQRI
jgi:hypothetical protein